MDLISKVIREMTVEWKRHPWDINNGMCEEFASAVYDRLIKEDAVWKRLCFRDSSRSSYGGHVWLYDPETGLHHDAEEPYGVLKWQNFPIFFRTRLARRELKA